MGVTIEVAIFWGKAIVVLAAAIALILTPVLRVHTQFLLIAYLADNSYRYWLWRIGVQSRK